MSQGREVYLGAQASLASYVDLSTGSTNSTGNRAALLEPIEVPPFDEIPASFIEATRDRFITDFSAVLHRTHDEDTGFGATVFQLADGGLSIAFRGSDDPRIDIADIIEADLQIYSRGAAFDQIVALNNWWNRASVAPGSDPQNPVTVPQFKIEVESDLSRPYPDNGVRLYDYSQNAGYYLSSASSVEPFSVAEGNIAAALANASGNVFAAGHSLGGHLAFAFATLFPTGITDAYGFNKHGFKRNSVIEMFFNALCPTADVRIFSR